YDAEWFAYTRDYHASSVLTHLAGDGMRVRGEWVRCVCDQAADAGRRHFTATSGRYPGPARRALLPSRIRRAIDAQAAEVHPRLGHGSQSDWVRWAGGSLGRGAYHQLDARVPRHPAVVLLCRTGGQPRAPPDRRGDVAAGRTRFGLGSV